MHPPPQDIKLKKADRVLAVTWAPGEVQHHRVRDLRCACRCAGCVDEYTGAPLLDPATVPEDVNIEAMQLVGQYAIQFRFTDGHDTGIYTWERLKAAGGG